MRHWKRASSAALIAFILSVIAAPAHAEDGYRLWLRYQPLPAQLQRRYAPTVTEIVMTANGAVATSALSELQRGLSDLFGVPVPVQSRVDRDGAVVGELNGASNLGS